MTGTLTRLPEGFAATLATLSLRQNDVAARLAAPATVTVAGGAIELTPLALDLGAGRLTAQGRIADTFDVDVGDRAPCPCRWPTPCSRRSGSAGP